jgi:hypothetical protein
VTDDEKPALKPVADAITGAIASADVSPANIVPLDTAKRNSQAQRPTPARE